MREARGPFGSSVSRTLLDCGSRPGSSLRSKRTAIYGAVVLLEMSVLTGPLRADSSLPAAPYANTQLPDPAQEAKAKALMQSLRCLVCQGQSIADSDADLAGDMRALVRGKIAAGETPEEVRAWLIARYGRWVSYAPPFDALTSPLWLTPLLLLVIGGWLAASRFKRGKR